MFVLWEQDMNIIMQWTIHGGTNCRIDDENHHYLEL